MKHPFAIACTAMCLLLTVGTPSGSAQRLGVGPDAAVGTEAERLASSVEFDSTGVLLPGEGFTASVRITWGGTAAFTARTTYAHARPDQLLDWGRSEAARAAFYNFAASAVRPQFSPDGGLPIGIEYDLREAMAFGNGGRTFSFYVPMLRVFRRIPPTARPVIVPPSTPAEMRRVLEATPPVGLLPVFDVGRYTARAAYEIPEGVWTTAPKNRRVETDFADFTSRYSVQGRQLRAERTVVVKKLTLPLDREPELAAFYQAVETDRRQTFRLEYVNPSERTEADRLNEQGIAAIDRKALTEATDILNRATELAPQHRHAWYNLGTAYLALRDGPRSVQALERALTISENDPFIRINLGQAYELAGRFDDADLALKAQVERSPHSAWTLQTMAGFYARRGRFADSVVYGERAADAAPDLDGTPLSLGHSYLALNRVDDAVKAFQRGLRASRNGATLNEAAWTLAERGVALDAAQGMIDAALDKIVASTTPTSMATQMPPLEGSAQIGAMWDTAGWILFKKGEAAQAVPWLEAAWRLAHLPEVGDHLATVFVSLALPQRAAETRTLAAEGRNTQPRVALPTGLSVSHDLLVIYDRAGAVLEVSGPPSAPLPAATVEAIRRLTIPVTAPPDGRSYRLARKASVDCNPTGECGLVFAVHNP